MPAHIDPAPCTLPKFYRAKTIRAQLGVSEAGLRHLVVAEGFPAPTLLGPRTHAWRESDVLAWIESRPTATTAAE